LVVTFIIRLIFPFGFGFDFSRFNIDFLVLILILQGNKSLYGRQRLWGAVGWGLSSFMSGVLIDEFHSVYPYFLPFFLIFETVTHVALI
jgi:hypothetical protein